MDKPVANVIKSKSSNSAIYTKTDKGNKKSRSNADFPPKVLKKRGMYVEKKNTRTAINEPVTSSPIPKAPPRPRPGSKKFLSSVLTILSKSTTGTQYPELNGPKSSKNKFVDTSTEKRTKKKYKSKILNEKLDEKLIVLQSTKNIINTPSLYSERSHDTLKPNNSKLKNNYNAKINKSVDLNGKKKLKQAINETIDDPATLVQDKKDPGLYNFFVDLLQTTFSAYNINDPNNEMKKPSVSKNYLAINESVAEKLKVGNEPVKADEISNLCAWDENWSDHTPKRDHTPPPLGYSKIDLLPKQKCWRPKVMNSYNSKDTLPKFYSGLFPRKKSYTAKNKKKIVLNLLKRQLRMDTNSFTEPQNLYQALRNIARNKRKHQKSIRFTTNIDGDECIFKQKKVISASNNRKRVDRPKSRFDFSNNYAKKHYKEYSSDESQHSIEVYDYDYEMDQKRKRDKQIFYARPSFISVSDQNKIYEGLIQVSEGGY